MTLVILAAGMGSRYGGLKQIDPVTKEGEFIIDFSVYDAILNGFDRVVFVIKRENLDIFRDTIGKRFESKIKVEYAFQELSAIPEGFSVPEGRVKPWGTAHALLSAKDIVDDPFMVINSDDFYGRSAYRLLAGHLSAPKNDGKPCYAMVGYILENTLTENGTVARGICEVDESGMLCSVTERTSIRPAGDVAVCDENGEAIEISLRAIASMNCWGFTPDIFDAIEKGFVEFLSQKHVDECKCEFYLPMAVCDMLKKGECDVKVYQSEDSWYGVTYKDDKAFVTESIETLKKNGVYPEKVSE
ncbi:MAG: nucleotidyltransferase [Clostridia bacterium]|nr:nucleotidyltransferase [Clostridia bacterium]